MAQIKIISNNEPLKTDRETATDLKKQWIRAKETGAGLDTMVDVDEVTFSLKEIKWISLKDNVGDIKEKASEKRNRENEEHIRKMEAEYEAEKKRILALSPKERSKLVNYFKNAYVCETGVLFDVAMKDKKVGELSAIDYVIQQQERYFTKYPQEQLIGRDFALKIMERL